MSATSGRGTVEEREVRPKTIVFLCACSLAWLPAGARAQIALASPDGAIAMTVAADAQGTPRYAVSRHGEAVLAPSPLGFNLTDTTSTGVLALRETGRHRVDRSVPLIASKAASAHERYMRGRQNGGRGLVDSPPEVQTTCGQALAMYVVSDSPFQMVSDSPDIYGGAPEFGFIREVPTTWDETRFLDGDVDSHVVVARRKGRDWYGGAMTNEQGRTVTLALSLLGHERYAATVWQDGAVPTEVVRSDRVVNAGDTITLALAPSGGGVVHLAALH